MYGYGVAWRSLAMSALARQSKEKTHHPEAFTRLSADANDRGEHGLCDALQCMASPRVAVHGKVFTQSVSDRGRGRCLHPHFSMHR